MAVQDDNNGALLAAKKEILEAQKKYLLSRDGIENVEKNSLEAYSTLLQILQTKLMEKYDSE